jgi:hypothetical protein
MDSINPKIIRFKEAYDMQCLDRMRDMKASAEEMITGFVCEKEK